MAINKIRLNREITAREVRLIGADGEQFGVVPVSEALAQAEQSGYDLAEIAPKATPPVAKLLDWGKYRYEQDKLEQKSRKKQKQIEVKGIRMGLKISEHDLEVKRGHARRFLEEGHKVRIALRFKGREITRPELGRAVLTRFAESLDDIEIEQTPELAGRELSMLLGKAKHAKAENSQIDTEENQSIG